MIGIYIIAHGTLGESLIQCTCHVLNRRPLQIGQLGVSAQDDPLDLLPYARTQVELLNSGKGVILLTDIFGSTPANVAVKLLNPGKVEGIAGVNLPMLLRILTYREKNDIDSVIEKAITGGCNGVLHMKKGL